MLGWFRNFPRRSKKKVIQAYLFLKDHDIVTDTFGSLLFSRLIQIQEPMNNKIIHDEMNLILDNIHEIIRSCS